MKKIEDFLNLKVAIFTFIIWGIINIIGIPNMYFIPQNSFHIVIIKILHMFFLYFIFNHIYRLYKQRNNQTIKTEIFFGLLYFVMLIMLLIAIWPGAWSWDDIGVLFNASYYDTSPWQHFFSGLFHIFGLQTIPFASGVIIIQCLIASLIVGYCISNISILFGKTKRQIITIQILLLLISLLPPLLLYVLAGFRMGIYCYVELLLVTRMLILYKEKRKITIKDILVIGVLTVLVSCWRTEAFYYPVFILFLFFILGEKVIRKKIAIAFFIILMICNYSIGKCNTFLIGNDNYSITATIDPVVSLIRVATEEDNEEINMINKVLDVNYILNTPSQKGEGVFWTDGVVRKYSNEEYSNYLKAYIKLSIKYPDIVFNRMLNIFIDAVSGLGNNYNQTTRNMIKGSGNTLYLYDENNGANRYWIMINSYLKEPINLNVRNHIISFLAGINSEEKITIIHNIFWNLFLPLALLLLCLIYEIIKRNWFMIFLILMVIARIPLIFVTASAPYFMYYLSVYLCSYVLIVVVLFEMINDLKKNKKNF